MSLEENLPPHITGIQPFDELAIDETIWREAHEHHHLHRRIHAISAHRPGIVSGLEVIAHQHDKQAVVVMPGVGVDERGRTIVVNSPTARRITRDGLIYVALSLKEEKDINSRTTVSSGEKYFRVVEGYSLATEAQLPPTPHLELARIYRKEATAEIRDAANPYDPAHNEINTLFRPIAFPQCYADAGVGELSIFPKAGRATPNRVGLWNLLREGNGRGFRLLFTGQTALSKTDALPGETPPRATSAEPILLYVAGAAGMHPLKDAAVEGLRQFLDHGNLLMGEASGAGTEFETDFKALAVRLGVKFDDAAHKVGKGNPLLSSHYVFAAPPPGAASGGTLLAHSDKGVIFSAHNYGGAWQGDLDRPDAPDARERIRQSVEFGLNIVAFAAQRRRAWEIKQFRDIKIGEQSG